MVVRRPENLPRDPSAAERRPTRCVRYHLPRIGTGGMVTDIQNTVVSRPGCNGLRWSVMVTVNRFHTGSVSLAPFRCRGDTPPDRLVDRTAHVLQVTHDDRRD